MTSLNWVIGAGGLLGSGVVRRLRASGASVFDGPRIAWTGGNAVSELAVGLAALTEAAQNQEWRVYWCAGAGVTDSDQRALRAEVTMFQSFLDAMRLLSATTLDQGAIVLASSAGAVYGGSQEAPFHEYSKTAPLGHYGRAKLAIEQALREFSESSGVPSFVGRISNLYGPGQSISKPQGLISRLCLSSFTRSPISVFVSLDTLRDYLYIDDCAELMISGGSRLRRRKNDNSFHMKVLASGRSVSVGALLSLFGTVAGRRPNVVMGLSPQATLQSRDLRLRSRYWVDLDEHSTVNLADGIARTLQDLRHSFLRANEARLPQ